MPHHAYSTMASMSGTGRSRAATWVRVCVGVWVVWGWCFPIIGSAPSITSNGATESSFYNGSSATTPPPPPPLEDFEITYKEAFASFVYLTISYSALLNFTKINVEYDDPVDESHHFIILQIGGSGFDPYNLYDNSDARLGFKYKLGGLYKSKFYNITFTGFQDKEQMADVQLKFVTGIDNGEDNMYNLTKIFVVLAISSVIVTMMMVCVGCEKVIQTKSEELVNLLLCKRRKKKKAPKVSISPEPLMVNDNRGFVDDDDSSKSNQKL